MPTHTTLKGFTHIGHNLLGQQLEHNLASFFQWGLLGGGAFFNVTRPTYGAYGGNQHQLRCAPEDSNYYEGQVWEGFRKDWVWESGVEYSYQPIAISGVYINGSFYASNTVGTYAHHIDYPNGRVVFDNAISTLDEVTIEYSYRWVQIYSVSTIPYFQELQANSFRVDDSHFMQQGSGMWSVFAANRVQLPAIFVESVPRINYTGHQLGGGQIADVDVRFHIFSEDQWGKLQLTDLISQQHDKTIYLFDTNRLADENAYPLNSEGSKSSNCLCYPDLVKESDDGGFRWKKTIFLRTYPQDMPDLGNIKRSIVRHTMRTVMPEI